MCCVVFCLHADDERQRFDLVIVDEDQVAYAQAFRAMQGGSRRLLSVLSTNSSDAKDAHGRMLQANIQPFPTGNTRRNLLATIALL